MCTPPYRWRSSGQRFTSAGRPPVLTALYACVACVSTIPCDAAITLQLAQTHVFDAPSKTFTTAEDGTNLEWDPPLNLHLVGSRTALAIVEFGDVTNPSNPKLSVTNAQTTAAVEIALNDPSGLPATYGDVNASTSEDGAPYSATAYSAKIPAELVKKGLNIQVVHDGGSETWSDVPVGAPTKFELKTLGLYLFGADPATTKREDVDITLESLQMSDEQQQEYAVRHPFASMTFARHPAGYFKSSYLVRGPWQSKAAYRSYSAEGIKEVSGGFGLLDSTLSILSAVKEVCGDREMATQYYGAVVLHNQAGEWMSTGGGWGGGMSGVGLHTYDGIMFHELGHGFNLPHVGGDYPKKYPYPNGGLKGSGWAYDEHKDIFYDVFYKKSDCDEQASEGSVVKDDSGRCYKQDVMQYGHHDEGMMFGLYSDFSVARIQREFEGTNWIHPKNGFWQHDVTEAGGYAYWNISSSEWFDQEFTFDLIEGSDAGKDPWYWDKYYMPQQTTEQDFALAVLTVSCPELHCSRTDRALQTNTLNDTSVTQMYPPMTYRGKTRFFLDLDDTAQLDQFHYVRAGTYRPQWEPDLETKHYCDFGCDWFASFTFAGGTVRRVVFPKGFREWRRGDEPLPDRVNDPFDKNSFATWAIAAPGGAPTRVDLFYLPNAYEGVHARVPQLITSWTETDGDVHPGEWQAETPSYAHTFWYELKLPVPSVVDRCDLKHPLAFHRALEKAAFTSLVESTADSLPPFTRVKLVCVCYDSPCPEDCEGGYPLPDWPDPEPVVSQTAIGGPAASTRDVKKPDCGCEFDSSKYNADTDTCASGTHVSALSRVDYSPGVHYYVDDQGRALMNVDSDFVSDWPNTDGLTLEETIKKCRKKSGCGMVQFEINHANNKTHFVRTRCMSPCYQYDYWERVGYHVDFDDNLWATPKADRPDYGVAMAFKFQIHVPSVDASSAAQTYFGGTSSVTAAADISARVSQDADFTRFLPWDFDAADKFQLSRLIPPTSPPDPPDPPDPTDPTPPLATGGAGANGVGANGTADVLSVDDDESAADARARALNGVLAVAVAALVA